MIKQAEILLASFCLLALALVSPVQGKVKSRGNLADYESGSGLPQQVAGGQFSFPINAQPMFAAQDGVFRAKDEVILSRNRNKNKMADDDKLEQLVQALDRAQSPLEDEINSQIILTNRDKKSKDTSKDESETSPLANHRRKNFFVKDNTADSAKTCPSQMIVQASTILDSKTSIQKGAKFLRVEYIELQSAKKGLNFVQEECKRLCCEDSACDTSLLAMKLNEVSSTFDGQVQSVAEACELILTLVGQSI